MLDNKDKRNPFTVPENYFKDFNVEILKKLPEKKENVKKNVSLWHTASRWVAVAAVVTGLAFVGIYYTGTNSSDMDIVIAADNGTSIEDDYYLFLEEEATRMAYQDILYSDN